MKEEVLYVFGGEKAQGAEIVIERLMNYNTANISAHLFIAPGIFADTLAVSNKPYKITRLKRLRKLNRSKTSKFAFYITALINYIAVPYSVFKYIRANKISIIHANTVVPASYLLPLIVFSKIIMPGKKWIWSDHDMKYFSSLDLFLAKCCVKLYNCTLAVSAAAAKKYQANNKVKVLYNGLDKDIFKHDDLKRREFRYQYNIGESARVLGIAASICPGKGVLPLIEVFNRLAPKFPDVLLFIAGKYADDDQVYNDNVKVAIANNLQIIHPGFVQDMLAFYSGCDVIISNSDLQRSESLGTTIYEAMACSKIVVASRTGGTPEIITDKVDGYLFEADNVSALEQTLEFVLTRPLSTTIAIAAREKVARQFGIDVMANNYNKVLQSL